MAEKEIKVLKKDGPAANVAYIGEKPWKPLVEVNTPKETIKLPEDQSKPFYHERARYLIQNFGHLYKPVKAKGDK